MISFLIPTYNCNATQLVTALSDQASALQIPYEIRLYDDASTQPCPENESLASLPNVIFRKMENNLGRTALRNKLAQDAAYEWLLFLDSDVLPLYDTMVETFVHHIQSDLDLIFGGIAYEETQPEPERRLRWKYGKCRESRSVPVREEIPYLSIISGCFLIRKEVFLAANNKLENLYGLDVLFTTRLKEMNVRVKHIDNPVVHLGLETNEDFIRKTESGLQTLHKLTEEGLIESDFRPIQKMYKRISRWGLKGIVCWFLGMNRNYYLRKSTSADPSLFCFDLYRLHYYCRQKRS